MKQALELVNADNKLRSLYLKSCRFTEIHAMQATELAIDECKSESLLFYCEDQTPIRS